MQEAERDRTPKRRRQRSISHPFVKLDPEHDQSHPAFVGATAGTSRTGLTSCSSDLLTSSDVESSCTPGDSFTECGAHVKQEPPILTPPITTEKRQPGASACATASAVTGSITATDATLAARADTEAARIESIQCGHTSSGCSKMQTRSSAVAIARKPTPGFASLWVDDVGDAGLDDDTTYVGMFGMFAEGIFEPGIDIEISERERAAHPSIRSAYAPGTATDRFSSASQPQLSSPHNPVLPVASSTPLGSNKVCAKYLYLSTYNTLWSSVCCLQPQANNSYLCMYTSIYGSCDAFRHRRHGLSWFHQCMCGCCPARV